MRNKNHTKRLVFLILTFLWMTVIFVFSAQNGETSGSVSGWFEAIFHLPGIVIRKGAHMTEYAVLAVFLWELLSTFSMETRTVYLRAFLISVCYAATDEFHQMFSEGRGPAVTDVLIDGAGAVLGLLVLYLFTKFYRKRKRK